MFCCKRTWLVCWWLVMCLLYYILITDYNLGQKKNLYNSQISKPNKWKHVEPTHTHPFLVINPPLVVLLNHHFNPPLPVAALQNDCLSFQHRRKPRFNREGKLKGKLTTTQDAFESLTSGFRWASVSEPSSGVTNPHTGFFLFSTSEGQRYRLFIKATFFY